MYEALVSIDLGRQHDFTAILVAEEGIWIPEPPALEGWEYRGPRVEESMMWNGIERRGWVPPSSLPRVQREFFHGRNYQGARPGRPPLMVRHIERVRGRSYVDIVAEIGALLARPPLADMATLALADAGGVGVTVSDLMWQEGVPHVSITATGGVAVNVSDGGQTIHCPKRELIAAAQIALAEGRLRISAGLEHAATLTKELQGYQVKISQAGHDSYSAREGEHDDLVYAAAQLCWYRDWYSQHWDDAIATAQKQAAREAEHHERLLWPVGHPRRGG
jgi:hypothetical protein